MENTGSLRYEDLLNADVSHYMRIQKTIVFVTIATDLISKIFKHWEVLLNSPFIDKRFPEF